MIEINLQRLLTMFIFIIAVVNFAAGNIHVPRQPTCNLLHRQTLKTSLSQQEPLNPYGGQRQPLTLRRRTYAVLIFLKIFSTRPLQAIARKSPLPP